MRLWSTSFDRCGTDYAGRVLADVAALERVLAAHPPALRSPQRWTPRCSSCGRLADAEHLPTVDGAAAAASSRHWRDCHAS